LEDAGCDPTTFKGSIGVFAGGSRNRSWEILTIVSGKQAIFGEYAADNLKDKDYLSSRISHKLDLKGPAISMYTACSTALVATDLACRSLLTGQCDAALAGGVSVLSEIAKGGGYLYEEGLIRSPDGLVRAFDRDANGTVFSHGAGVVLLKRLDDATADGNDIYAVIKGFATNNDGIAKSSFYAPAVDGQTAVIRTALYMAEVEPGTITYVEAHGTATRLGDPIEIEALKTAFNTNKTRYCAIGSVKTNIGHLDTAAGAAAMIKVALMMKHQQIPPSLNYKNPNPEIDFEHSPFFVNTQLREWKSNGELLRAGISSFGVGGTNVHLILEQAPGQEKSDPPARPFQLLLLSARTANALEQASKNFLDYLKENPHTNLADEAFTLSTGRKAFEHKKMLVCRDINEALQILEQEQQQGHEAQAIRTHYAKEEKRAIFMFPGQGSQYVDMARGVYETEPIFRQEMDRCFEILKPLMDYDLKEILYPSAEGHRSYRSNESYIPPIDQTEIAQPLIFASEYALAKLLMAWGITPYAMMGHSIGEYTAACLAGVFSLEEALFIAAWRGKLMQQMPPGSMLSIALPEPGLKRLLSNDAQGKLDLAAVNGPSQCVVSGTHEDIDAFARQLGKKKMQNRKLHTSHAYHSRMMEPILNNFREKVGQVKGKAPQIPFISNLTGQWFTYEDAANPDYWVRHLRSTVRFADGLKELLKDKNVIFIEVGPGSTLTTFTRQHPDKSPDHMLIDLVRPPKKDAADEYYLLSKLGQTWLYGKPIDWQQFYSREKRHRLHLPTYPFQRQRYWIEGNPDMMIRERTIRGISPGEKADMSQWFYIPSWKRSIIARGNKEENAEETPASHKWLVFADDVNDVNHGNFASTLVKRLTHEKENASDVTVVKIGDTFVRHQGGSFTIAPAQENHYEALIEALQSSGKIPDRIVHLWNLTPAVNENQELVNERVEKSLDLGFYSLIYLAKALGNLVITGGIQIDVVTCGVHEITGEEKLCPEKATVLGPLKVIPQEYPNISCRNIDITWPNSDKLKEILPDQLMLEILAPPSDTIVGYRNYYRWVQSVTPIRLIKPGASEKVLPLRHEGVYLVTGGLGGIGLILAEHLGKSLQAKLVLTGRSEFPPRHQWDQWILSHPADDSISRKIQKLKQIEEIGASVLVLQADVSNQQQMQNVLLQSEEKFGPLCGVIHCAGNMGQHMFRSIKEISDLDCREQFRPKVYGLLVLEKLLKDRELDFCLLMSSTSSILGGLGFVAYSAANIFMDAYVFLHKSINSTRWISVNWDGWQTGEAEEKIPSIGASIAGWAMTPAEGAEAFELILSCPGAHQVIQSAGDLQTRIDQRIKLEGLQGKDLVEEEKHPSQGTRPELSTPYVAPTSPKEQALVNIWGELLGYQHIGIQDDFFELGGDSLLATSLIAKIRQEFHTNLSVRDIFNSPNVKNLSKLMEIPGEPDAAAALTTIEPVEEKEYYAASAMQKKLYLLNQMEGIGIAYNLPFGYILQGKLDRQRLELTFQLLVQRHESLRTSFALVGNEPVQIIHQTEDLNPQISYWVSDYEIEDHKLNDLVFTFSKPFDLTRAPLLRIGLVKLAEEKHLFIFDVHHIVSDATSIMIMIRDFAGLYENEGKNLPGLKLRYKDFAVWQNNQSGKAAMKKQEEYWLNQFKGDIPLLQLYMDYPRPTVQSFAGEKINFHIDQALAEKLNQLIKEIKTTLFIVLLAAFNILLSKHAGQEDIIVGAPIAGRQFVDLEKINGVFINTLPIRNHPAANKTFVEFLEEVKENSLNAFENQGYPFAELIEKLDLNRDISRNPLYDVELIVQNINIVSLKMKETEIIPLPYEARAAQVDISLEAVEVNERIEFFLTYCTKLFKRETIDKFFEFFKKIISIVVENKEIKLEDITVPHHLEKAQMTIPQPGEITFGF
jgi:polyketide synthase PksJ